MTPDGSRLLKEEFVSESPLAVARDTVKVSKDTKDLTQCCVDLDRMGSMPVGAALSPLSFALQLSVVSYQRCSPHKLADK